MSRFIETIKLFDGKFYHLEYHQKRMDESIGGFFQQKNDINLSEYLDRQVFPKRGFFKCRIVYDRSILSTDFLPYSIKPIRSLKVVHHDTIDYSHKFENRDQLKEMYNKRQHHDEIIIVKNNLVTDSSYANLVFFDGKDWMTPTSFLLNGTMRQYLLDQQQIKTAQISLADITNFEKVKLINSMVGFDGPEVPVSQIAF